MGGGRPKGGECLQKARLGLGARGPRARGSAREARPDPSAMMVAAVRSPFSGGGAAMMQSPGPAPRPRALLPAFLSVPLGRVDVSRPTRIGFLLNFVLSDSSLLCAPRETGLGLECPCKYFRFCRV